jgi:peptidoglycan/xylan/chitin deacetylase (PgdA/CDA1 family)
LEEIRTSKKVLESELGKRVEAFAYPYGDAGKDGHTTSEALRQAGYRAAFLAVGSPISLPITDAYRLERLLITSCTNLKEALAP